MGLQRDGGGPVRSTRASQVDRPAETDRPAKTDRPAEAAGPEARLPAWRSVLVVIAHPDDETFGLGALIDQLATDGSDVHILCFSRGEASTLNAHNSDLRLAREAELNRASELLGAASVTLLEYPDGHLGDQPAGALDAHVDALASRIRPDGFLVFDDTGVTGHCDHRAATASAVRVAAAAGYPVLAWALPASVAARLRSVTGQPFAGHPPQKLAFRVQVDRGRQRRAARLHVSQISSGTVLWERLRLQGDIEHLRWLSTAPGLASDPAGSQDLPPQGPPGGLPTSPLLERISRGIIGEGVVLDGPFGPRRVTYADYTASGRSIDFIEDVIREAVLPSYANTHTESSGTGLQTTRLREEARQIIRDAVGGTDDDLVIFSGSGATAAVNKLIGILEMRIPAGLEARYQLSGQIPDDERPVVFVGPYEHHSNELPWRESIAEVVVIGSDASGHVDLADLERQLVRYAGRPLIGSFSAASNVTGILTDTRAVAALLHAHGALSFWDYAAAGPYVPIDVSPSAPDSDDGKDAVFLSPHKFPGGPQTPGVLVVRRRLVRNAVPTVPGGGTVAFVDPVGHRYLDDPVAREEGGTPAIVESIRAGLVVKLKDAVGTELIAAREERLWRHVFDRWADNPGIEILGDHRSRRLSIVSFRVRHGAQYLHHNFVVALLNDLFGIQARGGCSCAGPYGHRLLAIGAARSHALRDEVGHGCDGVKPGWSRINLNYFISAGTAEFIAAAVELIARYGYRLLPAYRFDAHTGLWRHAGGPPRPRITLREVRFGQDGSVGYPRTDGQASEDDVGAYLLQAETLLRALPDQVEDGPTGLSPSFEALRWFPLPPQCLKTAPD